MIYSCCNEKRRAAVLGNPTINGIDYLELADETALPASPPQRTLLIYCLKPVPASLGPSNVLVEGGESVTGVTASWVLPASATTAPPGTATAAELAYFNALENPNVLVVRTNVAGDFSPYTLRLVNDSAAAAQDTFEVTEGLAGFDPQLAAVTFSFKVECGPDFDCAPPPEECPPAAATPPPINYLAKDYGSFRTILLDRLNQLLPSWGAKSEADMGVVLAELMAYVGDQLSYQQDAVTTEAYLQTARSRISLRRHARLVDYGVHDGCNARAWIRLNVSTPVYLDRAGTRFYTFAPGAPSSLAVGAGNEQAALDAGVVVFEPMQSANLFPGHNVIQLYTWGDADCCLPKGATEATLAGSYPDLTVGDVLIFQEVMGPKTGVAADADIRHRYAVRLTSVATRDGRGQPLVDPLFEEGTGAPIVSAGQRPAPVTEIQWSPDDALPAPLCMSSTFLRSDGETTNLTGVSVAYGNVVLADQGLSMPAVALPAVPEPALFAPGSAAARCTPARPTPLPVRYRPRLAQRPVTQAVPLPLAGSPVTPSAVPLVANGYVGLTDSHGVTTLMVEPNVPTTWPQYFGVVASVNGTSPPTFDLSVVYSPPGTAPGKAVVLESFTNLTVAAGAKGDVVISVNGTSRLMRVSAPGATDPASVSSAPSTFSNAGPITLSDTSGTAYLQVTPTNPLSWPPQFAVLAQGNLRDPAEFNLLLVYDPPGGGAGVQVPVIARRFDALTLSTIESAFSAGSALLRVLSFEEQPAVSLSAFELTHYDPGAAIPTISLRDSSPTVWTAAPDLLVSTADDTKFVVEVESDGAAYLRFGDDTNGRRPASRALFTAKYRIGNGTSGNVGADSLVFLAADPRILACTNPLPAAGGVDPETMAQIRRRAPQAFLTQERAVTMTDYANVTKANPGVEDAAATLRWTGSWYTTFITAEPAGGANLSKSLRRALARNVNRYRLAGQDIQLEGPNYISLEIELSVCVEPDYFRADVEKSLLRVLGSGTLLDGEPALFAPGSFKLGQTVYLSPIYTAARTVAGVQSVTADVFQPVGVRTPVFLEMGEIPLGAFQVARMDNDPSRPANGQLTLSMCGGK